MITEREYSCDKCRTKINSDHLPRDWCEIGKLSITDSNGGSFHLCDKCTKPYIIYRTKFFTRKGK